MAVSLCQLPSTLTQVAISSSDTNPISLASAVSGKTVKLWGLLITGGTSVIVKSNTTALTGTIASTSQMLPLPSGNRADGAYPWFESAVDQTLNLVPGASGMNGIAWITQD